MATSELHDVFCANVRSRRKELGMTQAQVAGAMGISQSAFANIESGRCSPTLTAIANVCRALQTTASTMLDEHAMVGS